MRKGNTWSTSALAISSIASSDSSRFTATALLLTSATVFPVWTGQIALLTEKSIIAMAPLVGSVN